MPHTLVALLARHSISNDMEAIMPNSDGSGPEGAGAMTGWGLGPCGGARALGPGYGRGRGFGLGHGMGYGRGRGLGPGYGRGLGWLTVGYGADGEVAAAADMKAALEERKAFLRAELARTEALLGEAGSSNRSNEDTGK